MKLEFPSRKSASRTIAGDAMLVYDILSDYAAWPEWLPLVTRAKQKARETNFAHVDLELAPFRGRTVSSECLQAAGSRVLVKSSAGQDPDFVLDWSLASDGPGQTLVTVKCVWVHTPSNFKAALHALNPDLWLNGLAGQVASYSGDPLAGPSSPDTVLEIYETDGGLVCWYNGKKYEMKGVA